MHWQQSQARPCASQLSQGVGHALRASQPIAARLLQHSPYHTHRQHWAVREPGCPKPSCRAAATVALNALSAAVHCQYEWHSYDDRAATEVLSGLRCK